MNRSYPSPVNGMMVALQDDFARGQANPVGTGSEVGGEMEYTPYGDSAVIGFGTLYRRG